MAKGDAKGATPNLEQGNKKNKKLEKDEIAEKRRKLAKLTSSRSML